MIKPSLKILTFSTSLFLVFGCSNQSALETTSSNGNSQSTIESDPTVSSNEEFGTESIDNSYYANTKFVLDLNTGANISSTICTDSYQDVKSCLFYGDIFNDGNTPIDIYAEVWAEDVNGRQYVSEGKYSIFEDTINPGMKSGITIQFHLKTGVKLKRVYLVDVGGPDSYEILSTKVNLTVP